MSRVPGAELVGGAGQGRWSAALAEDAGCCGTSMTLFDELFDGAGRRHWPRTLVGEAPQRRGSEVSYRAVRKIMSPSGESVL